MADSSIPKNGIYPSLMPSNTPDNRDPNNINKHLQLDFYNVIAEPDPSSHNFEILHDVSHKIYQYSKLFMYRLLAILVGLPLMLCWGLIFGLYSFSMIWIAVPIRRLCQSVIAENGLYVQTLSDAVIAPLYRSFGQMFSSIRVTLSKQQHQESNQIQI